MMALTIFNKKNIPPEHVNVAVPHIVCANCRNGYMTIFEDGFWTCNFCFNKYWNN